MYSAGITTARDDFATDIDRDALVARVEAFAASELSGAELRAAFEIKDKKGWDVDAAQDQAREGPPLRKQVHPYCYRPFSFRHIAYNRGVVWGMAYPTLRHVLDRCNVVLIAMQQYQYDVPEYCYVFVSRWLTDSRVFVSKTGVATLLPLYLHPPEGTIDHEGRTPNLDGGFIAAVAGAGNLNWDAAADDWAVCGDRFGPQSTLGFIYAQLHAPSYREQFAEELRTSFPRVMLPGSRALFAELARLGGELAALHLMESGTLENVTPAYSGPGRPEVARVWWSDGTVWLDAPSTKARDGHRATKPGTMGFANVPEEVWDFYIGGYQVCYKWLKDRKGRRLSGDDLSDYQKIVAALGETIRIMGDIDDVIEEHGGWASAFATGEVSRK